MVNNWQNLVKVVCERPLVGNLDMYEFQHEIDTITIQKKFCISKIYLYVSTLLQILLGRGIHIDFSSQLKFAKIGFYGAFHL